MSDKTRNANIEFEEALEKHKTELKRREEQRMELEKGNDIYKRTVVIDLYDKLKETGFPEKLIPAHLIRLLEGYISKKHVYRTIEEITRTILSSNSVMTLNDDKKDLEQSSIDRPKKLVVTANGQTISEDPEGDEESKPIDEIYGGKSLTEMTIETDRYIPEDKEALENLSNRISNHIPLVSDKSPERRNYEAEIEGLKKALAYQTELASHAIEQHKKILAKSPTKLLNENAELKAKVSNLNTILYESNAEVRKEQSYKEIEILKLDKLRDGQIRYMSAKSERTIFVWVNPKTMEIIDIKTDREQHIIEARRLRAKQEKENFFGPGDAAA